MLLYHELCAKVQSKNKVFLPTWEPWVCALPLKDSIVVWWKLDCGRSRFVSFPQPCGSSYSCVLAAHTPRGYEKIFALTFKKFLFDMPGELLPTLFRGSIKASRKVETGGEWNASYYISLLLAGECILLKMFLEIMAFVLFSRSGCYQNNTR